MSERGKNRETKGLEESDNLPDPVRGQRFKLQIFDVQEVLNSEEIVEDLEAALEQFREIAGDLPITNPPREAE